MADTKKTLTKKAQRAKKPSVPKKAAPVKANSDEQRVAVAAESLQDDQDSEDDRSKTDYTALIKQIQSEYKVGWWHIKPKWDECALRYKLYNNQKRDKEAVGDNTLFSIFQTVLSSLYEDDLSSTFSPREEGDDETAENLTITAEYDYDEMEKDMIDYEWDFEALFHGRGLCAMMEFDRDRMVPVPEIWHAMTVIRDPMASSVNGDKRRRGAARFLYREIRMTKNEMRENGNFFNFEDLKSDSTSKDSLIDENMRIMAEAAGLSDTSKLTKLEGENESFKLLEGFTIHNGKRVFVTLADNMGRVVRYHTIENTLDIPIIDRALYPVPNSWDSVSVPDLVEDKQRARAVLTNLGLKSVKSSIHPMYLFNATVITNRSDLNFGFNKFIPVNGNPSGAVTTMPKDNISADVQYILDTLSAGAEKAAATPDVKQGARPQKDSTATRDALVSEGSDTRYSLAAKVFGWSEKRFWQQWYKLYKEHFNDKIDEKSVRIAGSLGAKWRPFTRENLITENLDPDVSVESRILKEEREFNELQQFRGYVQMLVADPEANVRFALRYMGKLSGLKKDIIDQLLPPTIDEIQAEEENIQLREGNKVEVLAEDDHKVHMEIHNKMEDTPEKVAHINAHKRAMLLRKLKPELFPQQPQTEQVDRQTAATAEQLPDPVRPQGRQLPVTA